MDTPRKLDEALSFVEANGYAIILKSDLQRLLEMNLEKNHLIDGLVDDNTRLLSRLNEGTRGELERGHTG